jgi:hypothetical protein
MKVEINNETSQLIIPKDNKQKVYCCSIRFGGCGYIDYVCNIPKSCFIFSTFLNRNEILCPLCLTSKEYNDMIKLTYVNFQAHIHSQNQGYVKTLLDASGIKEEWIYRV